MNFNLLFTRTLHLNFSSKDDNKQGSSVEAPARQNRFRPVQKAPATKHWLPIPCAKLLKLSGLRENDERRLCKRSHPDVTPWPSVISKPNFRFSENPESQCITASGVSYLQPSEGTPWRHTTTARGNGTFRQLSARPLMMNEQSAKSSYI